MKKITILVADIVATAFIVIDLFCGAGGTTTGFVMTNGLARVIACVNHDKKAIQSHWMNNPDVKHFEEDIRTLDLTELIALVKNYRAIFPNAKVILWASLECTNFSKAKGGLPRDADSRTLADHLIRYIVGISPDIIQIENVVEFMSWGPLNRYGKPISRHNGRDFMRWRKEICALGYFDEWKQLNAANFGAYTSRNRLFGMFAKEKQWITWPEPTHLKNPGKGGLFTQADKWKPVKDVLDFEDEGVSIFGRKKNLSPKTMDRIYAGLVKYVANGDTAFLKKYFSGRPMGKVTSINSPSAVVTTFGNQQLVRCNFLQKHNNSSSPGSMCTSPENPAGTLTSTCHQSVVSAFMVQRNSGNPQSKTYSLDRPARTITSTGGNQELVQANFILKYNSTGKDGKHNPPSVDEPCPVISTQNRLGIATASFLAQYNGKSGCHSVDEPANTLSTKDRLAKVSPIWLDKQYGGSANHQSVEQPAGSILANDKHCLINASWIDRPFSQGGKHTSINAPAGSILSVPKMNLVSPQFLTNLQYGNKGSSIEKPSPTLLASRRHYYLVNPQWGSKTAQSVDKPCFTLIERMDKAPPSIVITEAGELAIEVLESDCESTVKIKQFMAAYGIMDIKMRMLKVPELLKIQGFPDDYVLCGNQTDQKKFIGNSVVPLVVKCWIESIGDGLKKMAA